MFPVPPLAEILVKLLVLTSAMCKAAKPNSSTQNSPPIVRLKNREWNLPLDSKVGRAVTRMTIVDPDTHHTNISVSIGKATYLTGPFHDGSNYFKLYPLKVSKSGDKMYEIQLAKSLLGKFKAGDQFNLNVQAHDGQFHSKTEVYGRIEESRNIPEEPEITTSSITASPPPPTRPSPVPVTASPPTSQNSTTVQSPQDGAGKVEQNRTVFIVVPIVFITLGLSVILFFRKKLKKVLPCCARKKNTEGGKRDVDNVISNETEFTDLSPSRKTSMALSNFSTSSYSEPSDVVNKEWTKMDPLEFPRHHLKIYGILGEGCFGQVWKCEALNIDGNKGTTTVAVKTLKESASEKEKKDLLQELEVMKMLEPHPNVVRLLGCCTQGSEKDPIFVIMEYVAKGKLQEFLRKSRAEHYYGNLYGNSQKLTSRDLTQFCHQVAKGMEYLSSKKVIHRDLAARNILVTDQNVCKVADFGFSRDVMANNIYERKSEGRLPIRWMGPESLYDNIYTTKTDVWSFGVLMWEIVTLGSTPYPGMSGSEVMKKVKEGYRLEKPEHCDREIYNMMFYCWDKDPAERPSFTQLVKDLESLLTKDTDYIDLNQFPDHAYYNEVSLSGEKV